jgi:hypothetical protein
LQQNLEAVVCVRGDLGNRTDDSLRLRPADLERLVQAFVDDELERPREPEGRNRLVGLFLGEQVQRSSASRRGSCSVSMFYAPAGSETSL